MNLARDTIPQTWYLSALELPECAKESRYSATFGRTIPSQLAEPPFIKRPNPFDKYEHMFYYKGKRHIGGEGRAHETGIPPTLISESSAPIFGTPEIRQR